MPSQWPRPYSQDELGAIARSIGLEKLSDIVVESLQEAVERFQWGSLVDDRVFPYSTNKGRREQLKKLNELCIQGVPTEDISAAINELDGIASQLLGCINRADPSSVKAATEAALSKIPASGPDP